MKKFLVGLAAGSVLCLCMLEWMFGHLPVESGRQVMPTSPFAPEGRYLPRQPYIYSKGWALQNHQAASTNADGFVNSIDAPLAGGVMVVGDSYVEALMLPYRDTLQGQLEAGLPGRVSAVGFSGNGLADHLAETRLFADQYRPAVVVFLLEQHDFDGILDAPESGHSGFVARHGQITVVHKPYQEAPAKRYLARSALVRYLYYNLKLTAWRPRAAQPGQAGIAAPMPLSPDSVRAQRFFLSDVGAMAREKGFRVMFLLDGDRNALQGGRAASASAASPARESFRALAMQDGYPVIDMEPVFARHWRAGGGRLDFAPLDYHWNAVAHRLAAQEVARALRGLPAGTLPELKAGQAG